MYVARSPSRLRLSTSLALVATGCVGPSDTVWVPLAPVTVASMEKSRKACWMV